MNSWNNISRCMLVLGTGLVLALAVATIASAQSEGLSEELLDAIRGRCSNSQFALQQIEKRDAVSRINRGRSYDQMMRQVSALNSRFAYNKISAPDLVQLTGQLQEAINSFRSHYDWYDSDIADALKVNCREKPTEYYTVIVRARQDRNAVGDQVVKIAELMGQYRRAVVQYRETVE